MGGQGVDQVCVKGSSGGAVLGQVWLTSSSSQGKPRNGGPPRHLLQLQYASCVEHSGLGLLCTASTVPPPTHLLVVDAREVPHHDAPVGAARRENGLVLWAPANLREDRERGERGGACVGITKLPQLGEKGGVSHECQLYKQEFASCSTGCPQGWPGCP